MFQLGTDGAPSNTPHPARRYAPIHLLPQGEKGRPLLELIERSFYYPPPQRGFHGAHDRFRRRKDRSSGPRGGGQPDRAPWL
ncbi:hypothetical protein MES5069_170003 [Mesorhizobium escarrei]|uniref:Uncharacterized protein n=1 Tax=Mesorhizobium escarrei TaxID=666018 RepID=A0ABM9DKP5_9HYPH|nr:hypothetical protein MES5069_170003 [Mesorhizobium escarrei]